MNDDIAFPDTFLYNISWEDARADKPVLDVRPTDKVLTLTGGGDNVFNLVLDNARQVTCTDLNPAQYHLMELKLQTLRHAGHGTLWMLFGVGRYPRFENYLMDLYYNNHLSKDTYNFWYRKRSYFRYGLYFQGSMGKIVYAVCRLGVGGVLTNNVDNRSKWWYAALLWVFRACMTLFCLLFGNGRFMWGLCGTPAKQIEMITKERRLYEYVDTSLTNVFKHTDIALDNHHYYLVLNGQYTRNNCPDYLKERNLAFLKKHVHDVVINKNDSFLNVLGQGIYDKIILMDHLDWMDECYVNTMCDMLRYHMRYSADSRAIMRSASLYPWYIPVFEKHGLNATRVSNHLDNPLMDRVNTYASFWVISHNFCY